MRGSPYGKMKKSSSAMSISTSTPSTPSGSVGAASASGTVTSFGFELDESYVRDDDDDAFSLGGKSGGGGAKSKGMRRGDSNSMTAMSSSASFVSLPPI